jgi:FKBP-type peptidyl-prolyl cis-trans isomerase FkpA
MKTWKNSVGLILLIGACAACGPGNPSPDTAGPSNYVVPPSNAYEEAFAKEPGVRPITWGGWIKTEAEGKGESPNADNVVRVNYRGTLTDGTEFDSSYKRGRPAIFSLRNVISCWTNGVPMMKTGEKAKLVCPASTAYGDKGFPPLVPAGATLTFEIELIEVVK